MDLYLILKQVRIRFFNKKNNQELILSKSAIVYPPLTSKNTTLSSVWEISKCDTKGTLYRYMERDKPHVWMGILVLEQVTESFPKKPRFVLNVLSGEMSNDTGDLMRAMTFPFGMLTLIVRIW